MHATSLLQMAEQSERQPCRGEEVVVTAWREVGGGLGSLPEAGGGICGGVGAAATDTGEGRKQKW